jgi:hypothetical protein
MSLTFSMFGYSLSIQLFKNLFVPIERLDYQPIGSSLTFSDGPVDNEPGQAGPGELEANVQMT